MFFYFQAALPDGSKEHFWKYYDLKRPEDGPIIDNRYLIANLIACQKDTPRVVDPEMFNQVFELQEKVIEDIFQSVRQQAALEAAPRMVDPVQQTVTTAIQGYLNHPDVERSRALAAIRYLGLPMTHVQIRDLRGALREFQASTDIRSLLRFVERLRGEFQGGEAAPAAGGNGSRRQFAPEDLRLICFDFVSGGVRQGRKFFAPSARPE